jgi:hypothetical protein
MTLPGNRRSGRRWRLGPWQHRLIDRASLDAVSAYADVAPELKELYFAVRRVKRRIALANPVVDFSQLLFIDQPYPRGRVNDIHESIHRMGITATPGGRLLVLDGLHPGGQVRLLAPQEKPGSFWRPDLSFDARRVLFCYKAHDSKAFHLYEMNLDGTDLRQLTDSDYDDIDPIYLPDGHILFTTTRGNSHVRCGPFIYSYILARCDADGNDIYLISYNGEPDFVPSLLNDGRVIYSRWEYSDKPLWRCRSSGAPTPTARERLISGAINRSGRITLPSRGRFLAAGGSCSRASGTTTGGAARSESSTRARAAIFPRADQGDRRPALAGMQHPAGRSDRSRLSLGGPVHRLQDALPAFGRGFPGFGARGTDGPIPSGRHRARLRTPSGSRANSGCT